MRRIPSLRSAAFAATLLAVLASPAAATWSTSPFTSLPLCTAAGDQVTPVIAPDGSGGAFVAWIDGRGAYSVYATRVLHDGTVAPGWPVDGLGVCTAGGYKNNVRLVPGAAGDVFVLWEDQRAGNWDIYAQRVLGTGSVAPGWPANGLALGNDVRNQNELGAAPDGAGGLYAVWSLEYTPSTDYDIYATRVLPSGAFAPSFGVNGVAINGASYVQDQPDIAADGAGNAIIVYANEDYTATASIWGQKLAPSGARLWGSFGAGLQLSPYGNDQRRPLVVTDGAGGAIVSDVFSNVEALYMLLDGNGARRDQLLETLPVGPGYSISLVADGAGGAWVASRVGYSAPFGGYLEHLDARLRPTTSTSRQVYNTISSFQPDVVPMPGGSIISVWGTNADDVRGQGFDANVAPLWDGASVMVAGAVGIQFQPRAAWDGADGAIVTWSDTRNGNADIYAGRVDRFGALGDAAPALTRLADVPNDQGGFVSLQWKASSRDLAPSFPIARYSIWRRAPGGAATLHGGAAARVIAAGEGRPEGAARVIRAEPTAAGVVFWEYLSQVPARGYAGYSAVAPTTSDSIAGSNPRTAFRVEAEAASGIPYWDSAPDSAYSVDNLAPVAPAPFTGTYAGGTATLLWQPNAEPDLAGYRLYRGASPSFVPSPANLVTEQSQTGFSDPAGTPYWYKLAAVDVHGNVSPFSALLPAGTLAVDGSALPRELALSPPAPNPTRGPAALWLALPGETRVTLAIFDAGGRRVRTLASGAWPAGEHAIRWDGTNERGEPAGPGLYFARLQAGGRVLTRRLAMIR
jgi:hypothetical protein